MPRLDRYRLLGASGLRVSPLALGTLTFGWGADVAESGRIAGAYAARGGNFIDTSNNYSNGATEEIVGDIVRANRGRWVLAGKYGISPIPGDPNAGGNHRKALVQSLDASLKRLKTDYLDLYYVHLWDFRTSIEEVMRALDDVVRQGKVLHLGVSNTPAWKIAEANTLAKLRGWTPFTALQAEYNLVERTAERDLIPMCRELGLGVVTWAALAGGVLTGKYQAAPQAGEKMDAAAMSSDRLAMATSLGHLKARNLAIAGKVVEIAAELGATAGQVALAWLLRQPGITSPLLGVRTLAQLEENLGALDVVFSDAQGAALEALSAPELGYPHEFLRRPNIGAYADGGVDIETPGYRVR